MKQPSDFQPLLAALSKCAQNNSGKTDHRGQRQVNVTAQPKELNGVLEYGFRGCGGAGQTAWTSVAAERRSTPGQGNGTAKQVTDGPGSLLLQ